MNLMHRTNLLLLLSMFFGGCSKEKQEQHPCTTGYSREYPREIATLKSREKTWHSLKPESYDLGVRLSCWGCGEWSVSHVSPGGNSSFTFQYPGVYSSDEFISARLSPGSKFENMDSVFEKLLNIMGEHHPDKMDITYDPDFNFPSTVSIDWHLCGLDDESGYEVEIIDVDNIIKAPLNCSDGVIEGLQGIWQLRKTVPDYQFLGGMPLGTTIAVISPGSLIYPNNTSSSTANFSVFSNPNAKYCPFALSTTEGTQFSAAYLMISSDSEIVLWNSRPLVWLKKIQ